MYLTKRSEVKAVKATGGLKITENNQLDTK